MSRRDAGELSAPSDRVRWGGSEARLSHHPNISLLLLAFAPFIYPLYSWLENWIYPSGIGYVLVISYLLALCPLVPPSFSRKPFLRIS